MSNVIIVTTIGTSLLSNYQKFSNACNLSSIYDDNDTYAKNCKTKKELIEVCNKLGYLNPTHGNYRQVFSYISMPSEDQCAEVKSILKIKDKHKSTTIYVKLLATPSVESIFCGLIIQDYLKKCGIEILLGDDFKGLEIIEGLVVDNATQFERVGAFNLIESLSSVIAKRDRLKELERIFGEKDSKTSKKRIGKRQFQETLFKCFKKEEAENFISIGTEGIDKTEKTKRFEVELLKSGLTPYWGSKIIINVSGGYKAIVSIATLLAQLDYDVDIQYLYETSKELITIPKLPVNFDWEELRKYNSYLYEPEKRQINEGIRKEMRKLNILNQDDNSLTIVGGLMKQYFQIKTPMDNSVLGVYFEHILFEEIYKKIYIEQRQEYPSCRLERAMEQKEVMEGDIDVYVEFQNKLQRDVIIIEAKSIGRLMSDGAFGVMKQTFKRYEILKKNNNYTSALLILAIWHFPDSDAIKSEAKKIIESDENLDNKLKALAADGVQFKYTFNQIAYNDSASISENAGNGVFKKSECDIVFLDNFKTNINHV